MVSHISSEMNKIISKYRYINITRTYYLFNYIKDQWGLLYEKNKITFFFLSAGSTDDANLGNECF